jgi:sodium-dependent dicarboxylate transporter 2/3/5
VPDATAAREPPPERAPRTRWGILALALVVGGLAGLLAPRPWPEGDGLLLLTTAEETLAERPIRIGERARVVLEARDGARIVGATLPAGVPARGRVTAEIRTSEEGRTIRPALDLYRLAVRLPSGQVERVPIQGWDEKAQALLATRRPPAGAGVVLGLLGLVVVLWVTEAVPLFVTSLLVPVVLVATGGATPGAALAPFFHPIIALFFGGFLMAEAMRRVGLDHRAAITLVARAGRSPATLFAALVGVSAFLSMWMSNTASTALLVPIALAVTQPIGHLGYRKATVLAIAYAATIGGVGSAIGTPANPLAIEFLRTFADRSISFAEWFAFGLPMVLLFLPLMGAYLWWRSDIRVDGPAFAAAREVAAAELRRLGRPTREQGLVLLVFVAVVLVWLTQTLHGLDTGIVAVAGVVALALLGRLDADDLGRISWSSLLTFGGGLALGLAMVDSGASDWMATRLAGLTGLPQWLGVAVVALVALALTTIASNTATAAMLVPLAIPLAGVLGVSPTLLVLVVAIASSVDFALVIGTPPTMIAYSTRLFRASEIFRLGLVLDLLGIALLLTAVAGIWSLLGLL